MSSQRCRLQGLDSIKNAHFYVIKIAILHTYSDGYNDANLFLGDESDKISVR